ncbi:MAG: sulfurtransferase TusA family protein [Euryarchaeota archaeon]|nr:sulfurtransferase TusA family protein [Euryarchaeota archaeon]
MALRNRIISKTVDLRNKCCPSPVVEMKLAFIGMKSGEILEIIIDSDVQVPLFSKFCQKSKVEFECIEIEQNKVWKFLIKKP